MTFEYRGLTFNLLDTPGHQDFSEDTYRTLTAVDSAVMVIDAAKGIEAQTLKLFEVCRLREHPDHHLRQQGGPRGLGPLAIMDEIADRLALDVTPVLWPLGEGVAFSGCLDTRTGKVVAAGRDAIVESIDALTCLAARCATRRRWSRPLEQLELAQIALPAFDLETYRAGHLTPVFFGSALTDVGVARAARRHRRLGAVAPAAARRAGADRARPTPKPRASCSRSRPTWTPTTATASPSCGSARANSTAA